MALALPPLRVTFDDGETFDLEPRPRDMALAEVRFHHDYSAAGGFASMYATALACLTRMNGLLGEREVPTTIDALMLIADVEPIEDPDAEGKDSAPAPGTG